LGEKSAQGRVLGVDKVEAAAEDEEALPEVVWAAAD
jgi:hypothetical protein